LAERGGIVFAIEQNGCMVRTVDKIIKDTFHLALAMLVDIIYPCLTFAKE